MDTRHWLHLHKHSQELLLKVIIWPANFNARYCLSLRFESGLEGKVRRRQALSRFLKFDILGAVVHCGSSGQLTSRGLRRGLCPEPTPTSTPLPTSLLLLLLFSQSICRVWVGWRAKLDVAFFARWCRVSHHELQSFLVFGWEESSDKLKLKHSSNIKSYLLFIGEWVLFFL